jgi:hypothetical protein
MFLRYSINRYDSWILCSTNGYPVMPAILIMEIPGFNLFCVNPSVGRSIGYKDAQIS